ncbi:hypothetical protein TNCV_2492251 [Trichonephila clavipes]|nr:hypothetical protein TNCV_2492251 [Trichonephila clavipes]
MDLVSRNSFVQTTDDTGCFKTALLLPKLVIGYLQLTDNSPSLSHSVIVPLRVRFVTFKIPRSDAAVFCRMVEMITRIALGDPFAIVTIYSNVHVANLSEISKFLALWIFLGSERRKIGSGCLVFAADKLRNFIDRVAKLGLVIV